MIHTLKINPSYNFAKSYYNCRLRTNSTVCVTVLKQKEQKQCWKKVCTTKYFQLLFSVTSIYRITIQNNRNVYEGKMKGNLDQQMNITGWYKKQINFSSIFSAKLPKFLLCCNVLHSNCNNFQYYVAKIVFNKIIFQYEKLPKFCESWQNFLESSEDWGVYFVIFLCESYQSINFVHTKITLTCVGYG